MNKVVRLHDSYSNSKFLDANAAHARIYCEWRHLPSFKSLSLLQRAILVDVLLEFTKLTGNETRLTISGTMKKYGVGHVNAKSAIAGLEERGWIERIGFSPGPTGQAGGRYKILCISPQGKPVSGPHRYWGQT